MNYLCIYNKAKVKARERKINLFKIFVQPFQGKQQKNVYIYLKNKYKL